LPRVAIIIPFVREKLRFPPQSACLIAFLICVSGTIFSQKHEAIQPSFNPAAYRVGERLTYIVSYSRFVSAAHIELFVASRGKFFDRDGIELRAHVETTGVVNVALFAINNDYTTYVDPQTGLPFRSQQVVREAGHTTEAARDYNQPAGAEAIPPKLRTGEYTGTYDLLSALYRVRAMSLSEGSSSFITVRNESDEYTAEVRVVGRETLKTNVGSFNTVVTRINVKSGHDYNLRAYFSDDERHVPVLITAKVESGELRAELAGSEFVVPGGPATPVKPTVTPGLIAQDSRTSVPSVGSVTGESKSGTTPTTLAGLDLPFKIGEQLIYRVYLGDNPQPVGTITFSVRSRGRYFNRDGLLFSATAQTSALGARVFFVNDQVNSYVDPETLLPFRTELNLAEGNWRATKGYTLDQNRGSAVTDKSARIDIPVGTHDLLSALYAIRTFDLSRLKQNAISILATDKPRTLLVNSVRRETVDLNGQQIPAIFLTLTTDDPQTDKMQLRMWVGDDSRHLPLRIVAATSLGVAHADLVVVPLNSQ
jgi:Protein of unknown function (DUF3108)